MRGWGWMLLGVAAEKREGCVARLTSANCWSADCHWQGDDWDRCLSGCGADELFGAGGDVPQPGGDRHVVGVPLLLLSSLSAAAGPGRED